MTDPANPSGTVDSRRMGWHLVDHLSRGHRANPGLGSKSSVAAKIIAIVEPTLFGHQISPVNRNQQGSAVVWCSPVDQIHVVGQDVAAVDCTDLWVEVDTDHNTIAAHLEGEDLARHVSRTGSMFKPAEPIRLW